MVTLLGIASGLATSAFVAVVNIALHQQRGGLLIASFAGIAVVRVAANLLAQWYVINFAQQAILDLCDELSRRVVATPFRTLERVGAARIMTTLTDDVGTLSAAFTSIPSVIINGAILIGCTAYLAWLSWTAALVLAVCGALGAFGFKLFTRRAASPIAAARAERDVLFRHFRTLTEGIKEIKLNRARRTRFIDSDLALTIERVRRLNLAAMRNYLAADGWAQLVFFLVMGVMLFALPNLSDIPVESLTGFAFVGLYAMAPIWGFLNAMPTFQRGSAALARFEETGLSLTSTEDTVPTPPRSLGGAAIELRGVTFEYEASADGSAGFVLGPVHVSLAPGELVFIIGGNGSGKSTFVKLLTGLYAPDSGEITLNGAPVTDGARGSYREHFSTVFSDFFLFNDLTGHGDDLDRKAESYLKLLDLDRKVSVRNGVLSTTALSQGQRRRLALLAAYLEDRPIYVFDEWAADQDPVYREIFYARFLPELKARGKTVVVITHDDRYFHLGDRVIKLEYGRIAAGAGASPVVAAV